MAQTRKIEIFSAGCAVCEAVVERIKALASPSCEIDVLDMKDASIAARAENLGIRSLPAVAINGTLADCCSGRGIDMDTLRDAGLGQPIV
ncbi:MAG: thioredoxin family protein [Alphaproteobacteria bacterium]|nr:thioredoxin family protein [Alphaproteobacteria bacterium]